MGFALATASHVLLIAGTLWCLFGAIGIHRLPEFYSRLHAAGMVDSLAAPLILVGLMLKEGATLVTIKLLTILTFVLLTSPATTSALAQAAYWGNVRIVNRRKPHAPPQAEQH